MRPTPVGEEAFDAVIKLIPVLPVGEGAVGAFLGIIILT
jgi:hypothetical protein